MPPPFALALGAYILASLVTFAAFAWDKRAAAVGRRRVPERTLHTLEALGGFPGAVLAMFLVRHKNRKPRYWLITALIAAVHATALAWFLYRTGSAR